MPLVLFWPRSRFDGLHWSGFIHDWVILPDLPNLFVRGKAKNSIFGRGSLPGRQRGRCLSWGGSVAEWLERRI